MPLSRIAQRTIRDIKSLKIQGARNIARAAVGALAAEARAFKGTSRGAFISALLVAADEIAATRPNEPMLRNYLRYLVSRITGQEGTVDELKQEVAKLEQGIYVEMELSKKMLVDYGSQLIKSGGVYYTHCHSSTVVGILKEAYDDSKDFSVIVSETRPRYQGLKTAKALASYGIPTTLIVDSAAHAYVRRADAVLVGADSVSASGDLINKIGTCAIAQFARSHQIPFYSAAELYKFDHLTKWGMLEPIEMRDPKEVYAGPVPKALKIENPAFDLTPAQLITAYITERGIIPPQSIMLLTK
ncbi:MAG: S-methyl-5-thioribose-1-phosphate isomerase [Candidatus Micrarchaeia archaeon]